MAADTRPGLASLFPDLKPEEFLEQYWGKKHYFCHAPTARLASLFEAPALRDVGSLLRHLNRESRIRAWFTSKEGKFTEVTVDARQAEGLYQAQKFTIVMDTLEARVPETNALLRGLCRDLETPMADISCSAYASAVGAGTRMHFDQQEVFFLQLRGEKKWRVAPMEEVRFPALPHFGGAPTPVYQRMGIQFPDQFASEAEEVVLRPGSVAYLPRGTWHASETGGEDSFALTLSFASMAPANIIIEKLQSQLLESEALRRPLHRYFRADRDGLATKRQLESVLSTLKEQINRLDADQLLEAIEKKHEAVLRQSASLYALRAGFTLQREEADGETRFTFVETSTQERTDLDIEPEQVELLSWLAASPGPFRPEDAPPATASYAAKVFALLLDNGFLRVL